MSKDNPILVALQTGRKAFRAGDFESALEACLKVLEFVPNHPLAHMMAGFAQQAAGHPEKAIRHLRFALAHDPADCDTRDALAMCLLARGRHAEALPHLRQVVAAQPDNANARYNLGRCLLDLRNFVEAERVYSEHIERNPGDAEAFNHLGLARLAKGNASEAEPCFRSAIQINGLDPLFHVNLAQSLAHTGRTKEAGASYERAIELDPAAPGLRVQHGWFLLMVGNLSLAEDRFREALQRDPEHEGASAGLAAALERRREVDVGIKLLRPFISAVHPHPKVAISYATLSRRQSKPNQALPVIRRAIRPGVPRREEAALRFAEGDLLDAMGEIDAAFDAYQRANEAQGSRYNSEAHEAFVSDLISVFTPELFASIPKPEIDTESSVLVCGMPRSGSSLVEQILATHPDIHGAGELDDLSTIAAGLHHYIEGEEGYPGLVRKIDTQLVNRLAEARMESLRRTSDKPLVIDKLPHNFMNLGLAAIITPGVRVIHTVRDPVDTCLSCYFQHFGGPSFTFSNHLEALSSFFRQYRRLMAHWEAVLPIDIHTVRYEDMVAETKKTSQEVLAFLGCDWDESVLNFHMNQRIVATASYAQVREPIYSSSVGRAERYRHRIGALVSLAQLQM
jgi:tetratricopeptide (TPR) repeat protein